jgi:hypothetical protein
MPQGYPNHMWSGSLRVGRSTDDGFAKHIVELLKDKIESDLAPVTTIEAFYGMTIDDRPMEAGAGPWALSRSPAHHAVVLAALGRLGEVAAVVEQEVSRFEPYWHRTLQVGHERAAGKRSKKDGEHLIELATKQLDKLTELGRLRDLAQADDRLGVIALLRRWEAQRIKAWELEDVWTPMPFPIEIGARS